RLGTERWRTRQLSRAGLHARLAFGDRLYAARVQRDVVCDGPGGRQRDVLLRRSEPSGDTRAIAAYTAPVRRSGWRALARTALAGLRQGARRRARNSSAAGPGSACQSRFAVESYFFRPRR